MKTIPSKRCHRSPPNGRTPAATQVNEVASDENFAEILLPKNVTAVIATIAMNADKNAVSGKRGTFFVANETTNCETETCHIDLRKGNEL